MEAHCVSSQQSGAKVQIVELSWEIEVPGFLSLTPDRLAPLSTLGRALKATILNPRPAHAMRAPGRRPQSTAPPGRRRLRAPCGGDGEDPARRGRRGRWTLRRQKGTGEGAWEWRWSSPKQQVL